VCRFAVKGYTRVVYGNAYVKEKYSRSQADNRPGEWEAQGEWGI
jgi:hypothetical protein